MKQRPGPSGSLGISNTGYTIIPGRRRYHEEEKTEGEDTPDQTTGDTRRCHALEEHLPRSLQEFRKPGLVKDGIYKRIEFAIEDMVDICAIHNTDLALGVPDEEEDILDHRFQNGIIGSRMFSRIRGLRGFRNIVVHRYGTIDDALAFQLLKENIGDFSLFRKDVEEIIERLP